MNRDVILATVMVLAAGALATTMLVRHGVQNAQIAASSAAPPMAVDKTPVPPVAESPVRPQRLPAPATQLARAPQVQSGANPAPSNRARSRRGQNAPNPAAPVAEPAAREALGRVGFDPAADAVWVSAINDPALNNNQRRNLIEDLNETGFQDPRNLTADDLPVIEYRIALIEQLAPDSMDDVNAAAFDEAYKDLVNMRARASGQ